jgi:ribulose 1,5-bisphosphate synthetase/thiazole synthase
MRSEPAFVLLTSSAVAQSVQYSLNVLRTNDLMHALSISIIGAGFAGLAAATLLARAGHRVTVFDQLPRDGEADVMGDLGQSIGIVSLGATRNEDVQVFARVDNRVRIIFQINH